MPDLSILLPTRGRVPAVERMLRSVLETAVHPERIEVLLTADFDDCETRQIECPGLHLHKQVGPQYQLGEAYRRLWAVAKGDVVLLATDSLVFQTFGWDRAAVRAVTGPRDGIALAWCGDTLPIVEGVRRRPTHLFAPRSLNERIGGLGIETYRSSHVTAHLYDVFRQLTARGHERRVLLSEQQILSVDDRPTTPQSIRSHELDERTYLAWVEERRWLAMELEHQITAAANKPQAQPQQTQPQRRAA